VLKLLATERAHEFPPNLDASKRIELIKTLCEYFLLGKKFSANIESLKDEMRDLKQSIKTNDEKLADYLEIEHSVFLKSRGYYLKSLDENKANL
jgi:hypothetical protein